MELEYAFLAKFIDTAPGGLFSAVGGGVTTLAAERFPTQVPTLYLLVRVNATPEEAAGGHLARLTLTGPAGKEQPFVLESPLPHPNGDVPRPGEGGHLTMNLVLGINNCDFPEPGAYTFHVRVDGREIGCVSLRLEERGGDDAARRVDTYPLSNERLLAYAARNPPPQSWYEQDEDLFE